MTFRLRDDLHWCNCGGRAIFLDLAADRYFCLPSAVNATFLSLASGGTDAVDATRVTKLVDCGVLVGMTGSAAELSPALVEPTTEDYLVETGASAPPMWIVRTLISETRLAFALRTGTIKQVIDSIRQSRPKPRPDLASQRETLRCIAAAANAAALVTRAHDRCLVRGFAILTMCKKAGIPSNLVFGVIARPFAAHCWVQHESAVLVGGFEQVRQYTPILVVE